MFRPERSAAHDPARSISPADRPARRERGNDGPETPSQREGRLRARRHGRQLRVPVHDRPAAGLLHPHLRPHPGAGGDHAGRRRPGRGRAQPGDGRDRRPDHQQVGQVPALGPVERAALRHHRRPHLHDARSQPRRQGDLRLGDLHRAAGRLHHQQRALCLADRRHDRRPGRADQHLLVPPDRGEHRGPHHRQLRHPARRHPRPGQRCARVSAHDGAALGRERRSSSSSPSSSPRSASSPIRSRRPRSPRTCRTCSATGPSSCCSW